MNQQEVIRALADAYARPPVVLSIDMGTSFALVTSMQLLSRHPDYPGNRTMHLATDAARKLQDAIAPPDTELGRWMEQGWHAVYDVPRGQGGGR